MTCTADHEFIGDRSVGEAFDFTLMRLYDAGYAGLDGGHGGFLRDMFGCLNPSGSTPMEIINAFKERHLKPFIDCVSIRSNISSDGETTEIWLDAKDGKRLLIEWANHYGPLRAGWYTK